MQPAQVKARVCGAEAPEGAGLQLQARCWGNRVKAYAYVHRSVTWAPRLNTVSIRSPIAPPQGVAHLITFAATAP
jgi:hypothetical protein